MEQLEKVRRGYDHDLLATYGELPEPPLESKITKKSFREDRLPEPIITKGEPVVSKRSTLEIPNVIGDELRAGSHGFYDQGLGAEVRSKSERRRIAEEKGLIMKSPAEEWRDKEKPNVKGRAIIYPGQTSHNSSAERGGVRTKAGQLVI
jgi:hypothetical protein